MNYTAIALEERTYPGRLQTPEIRMNSSPFVAYAMDAIALAQPDSPEYIDAFIRRLRVELKRRSRSKLNTIAIALEAIWRRIVGR